MAKYMDLFDADARSTAQKALAYFDGESKEYLQKFLATYRKNALKKGMAPRVRNLTRPIIEKSGMLFNGRPPVMEVYSNGADVPDEAGTEALINVMEAANWVEFFTNFDNALRLLKTAYVLVQVAQLADGTNKLFFTILSQHNCAVHIDPMTLEIDTLIYGTGKDKDSAGNVVNTFRIITPDYFQPLFVGEGQSESVDEKIPNPFGIITAAVFHDTNTPRDGVWNKIPLDIMEINDIYNQSLTDSEFSMMHAKMPTLFTTGKVQGSSLEARSEIQETNSVFGQRMVSVLGEQLNGGPGDIVGVDTNGEPLYLEYKGPTPEIKPFDDVVNQWVRDFAADWSVSMNSEGDGFGNVQSGFALMAKEIPNAELRKKRQRMFEAGFKRLYKVLLSINKVVPLGLTENADLFASFAPPDIPVDEKSAENIWTQRIKEGRSSDVEYFIVQQGLSRAEAEAKVRQLAEDRALLRAVNGTPVAPVATGVNPAGDDAQTVNVTI